MSVSPSAISSIWALSARADPKRSEDRTAIFASGKGGGRLFGDALDTGAHGGHLALDPAGPGRPQGRGFVSPHWWQTRRLRNRVFHHARVAMVTAQLRPAGPAERHGRIAPAVQEQQGLFRRPAPSGRLRRSARATARIAPAGPRGACRWRASPAAPPPRTAPSGRGARISPPRRWPSFPSDGVAEASTTCAPFSEARSTAMSRAL